MNNVENTVNILGTEYKILKQKRSENPKLKDNDGLCETYSKEIIIVDLEPDVMNFDNIEEYLKKVERHEIIHAFLFESGLDVNSEWARNEELVDWIAMQSHKMASAFKKLDI